MNFPVKRMLSGIGNLHGPDSDGQFKCVVELIQGCLLLFAESVLRDHIQNENGLNRKLSRLITNVSANKGFPFFAQPESMEDEARGNSPAADIGIYLHVDDIASDTPKITVFEGKRLNTYLGKKRQCEYVFGHDENGQHVPCGGIERFKLAIHGRDFYRAGMIGYLQDETPVVWQARVNVRITDLAQKEYCPKWSEKEWLVPLKTEGRVSTRSSVVCRHDSEIHLTHLWVDLVQSQ